MMSRENTDYSTLEVNREADLPQVRPSDGPELVQNPSNKEEYPKFDSASRPTHGSGSHGARKKTLRLALILVLIILTSIGVGLGVGLGVTRGKSSTRSDRPKNPSVERQGIAPNSGLSATNYTDQRGVEHSQVYYQDKTLQLWMADKSMSSQIWNFSHVVVREHSNKTFPKNGTPISAYNWLDPLAGGNQSTFRCLFVDNSSNVRALSADWTNDNWKSVDGLVSGLPSPYDPKLLAQYTKQCGNDTCIDFDIIAYWNTEGALALKFPHGLSEASGPFIPPGVQPDSETAVALAPIPVVAPKNYSKPKIAMYLRNSAGNLTELYDEYGHNWYKTKLQTNITIDRGSQLAALSRLDDGLLKIQVLASKSDGGVKMAFLNGTLWNELDSVNGMESVLPLSPIAATQAGYVYTLGEGHQVVEWVRNNSSPPTFLRLGTINTTNV